MRFSDRRRRLPNRSRSAMPERPSSGGVAGIGDRKGSLPFEVHSGTAIRRSSPAPMGNGRKRLIV